MVEVRSWNSAAIVELRRVRTIEPFAPAARIYRRRRGGGSSHDRISTFALPGRVHRCGVGRAGGCGRRDAESDDRPARHDRGLQLRDELGAGRTRTRRELAWLAVQRVRFEYRG